MQDGRLGRRYEPGEAVCRQGHRGGEMYVIQFGTLEVVREVDDGPEVKLGELHAGEVFGEMAIFTHQSRSATVRAKGEATVLTLDRKGFLRRVADDPTLAFNILESLSTRVQQLDEKVEDLERQARH